MPLDFKNIIVRMPNWIGDMVMATPILSDLRKAFPQAQITAMCRMPTCALLLEAPEIDELFCFHTTSLFGRHDEKRNILGKLYQGKYDLGILLTNSFSSAWLFWQGGVKRRIGYARKGLGFLLTDPLFLSEQQGSLHLVDKYKALLTPLGIEPSETLPKLYLKEAELEEARELLRQRGVTKEQLIVGINPGAAYGSAKCWLPERFRALSQKLLQEKEIAVVYFGDSVTSKLVEEICKGLPSRVVNLAGVTSLRELASLISVCDLLLTNDSGPMHIASAVGTSVVALFGSTNERITGPLQNALVIHKHVECSPCYRRKCPIDFRCMKQITVDEVYATIMRLLQGKEHV